MNSLPNQPSASSNYALTKTDSSEANDVYLDFHLHDS